MRRKFNSDAERKAARTIQNREAQKRSRAKAKLKPKPTTKVSTGFVITPNDYKKDYFDYCAKYPFSHLITFTNEKLVTLNMHDKAIMKVINWLVDKGYITNYLKTNEYDGGNYHSHILVQINKWGINLRELITGFWSNGFFRVDLIKNDTHRLNAIRYCLKQIDVTSNSDLKQSIVDTMDVQLPQSFNELKKARIGLLEEFKRAHGLVTLIKYIAPENRLPSWN